MRVTLYRERTHAQQNSVENAAKRPDEKTVLDKRYSGFS